MCDKSEKIKELIIRCQLGILTPSEHQMLDAWRDESEKHEQLYQRLMDGERTYSHLEALDAIDVNKAFIRNQKLLQRQSTRRIIRYSISWAAIVALIIGLIQFWPDAPQPDTLPLTLQKEIEPGSHQAELVFADGSSVQLLPDMKEIFRDGSSEVTVTGNKVNYSGVAKGARTDWHLIRTPLGGEYSITLADGTVVWLNAMSELKYPVRFDGKERRVELKGEAYFQVKHNADQPFYVGIGDYQVKVLGTSFNVKAYANDQNWETTLCTGSVNLEDLNNQKNVVLTPGKQAICSRDSRQIEVKEVDTDLYTAWTKGEFRFDNTSVEEIFTVLQRWYNIEVFYTNSQVRHEVFTGKLPRFDNLQVILNIMEKVSNLHFEVKGNTVFIK